MDWSKFDDRQLLGAYCSLMTELKGGKQGSECTSRDFPLEVPGSSSPDECCS